MARKQQRIKRPQLAQTSPLWLGKPASVVLRTGEVHQVHTRALEANELLCTDHGGIAHGFPLDAIYELILHFQPAEHAQTPAD